MADVGSAKHRSEISFNETSSNQTGWDFSNILETATLAEWRSGFPGNELTSENLERHHQPFTVEDGASLPEQATEPFGSVEAKPLETWWDGIVDWSGQTTCRNTDAERQMGQLEPDGNSCYLQDMLDFDQRNEQALPNLQPTENDSSDRESPWPLRDDPYMLDTLPPNNPWPTESFPSSAPSSPVQISLASALDSTHTSRKGKDKSVFHQTTRQISQLWSRSPSPKSLRRRPTSLRAVAEIILSHCRKVSSNASGEPGSKFNEKPASHTPPIPYRPARSVSTKVSNSTMGSADSWQSDDWHLLSLFIDWVDKLDFGSSCLFVSSTLPYKSRIELHAVANTNGLSHMSVGIGERKRLIATPFWIDPHSGSGTRWGWKSLLGSDPLRIDPTCVCVHVPGSDELALPPSLGAVQEMLVSLRVAQWKHIKERPADTSTYGTIFELHYTTANDALRTLNALEGISYPGLGDIRADYPVRKGRTRVATTNTPFILVQTQMELSTSAQNPTALLSPHFAPRKPSRFNYTPRKSMNSSSGISSGLSSDQGSHYSVESSNSKKRKRNPKIENGYRCPDCPRLWSLASERDKHWRNVHGPKPHECYVCGAGFVYAKDVLRHLPVH